MSADLEVQIMNNGRPSLCAIRLCWPTEEALTGQWAARPLQRTWP